MNVKRKTNGQRLSNDLCNFVGFNQSDLSVILNKASTFADNKHLVLQ